MNEIADTSEAARQTDPREVLDGIKRAKIAAMLEMGCSRRVAAVRRRGHDRALGLFQYLS